MAEENVQKLLDMLYEMIDEAKNAPLSNDKCVLNRDEALDLLDEIRAQMPVELKRAQELVRARDEYVEAAKRDVERMMQKAEFEAKSKVSESEVLTAAHLILHEPLKRNHLIAIGIELIGILFILNPAKLEVSPRGFAEILTATVLFAMYGTLCKLRIPRLGGLVITTFNMVLGGLELLALLLLGHIPAVGALYRSLGLDIFADVPFFTGFTLRSALLLCYVGIFCAAFGFLLTAKITEYTSATEASFVYLIKPVLATLLAVVCFHEAISVNRMIGLVFFLAASLCVSVPVLREMRRDAVTAQPPR